MLFGTQEAAGRGKFRLGRGSSIRLGPEYFGGLMMGRGGHIDDDCGDDFERGDHGHGEDHEHDLKINGARR